MNQKITITIAHYCFLEIDEQGINIGDDMHMNGMDSPARIHNRRDLDRLISALEALRDRLPA